MFLTGFADEASKDLREQISATQALGWSNIEARFIGEKFMAFLSDEEFEEACQLLEENSIQINCYGSGVANWGKDPWKEEDFELSKKELLLAIPRMKRLGTKMIRGMSFKVPGPECYDSADYEKNIFSKVNELVQICADNGILYGHENCMNYGGQSYIHTLRLVENIKSDAFKLIFDTGNPVFNFHRVGDMPFHLQDAWEFYTNVREFIHYVHIKDCVSSVQEDGSVQTTYTYAGEGNAKIPAILTDLFKHGYDGGFSIEPHVAVVFHDTENKEDAELLKKRRFETYVDYGKRFEVLLKECKAKASLSK